MEDEVPVEVQKEKKKEGIRPIEQNLEFYHWDWLAVGKVSTKGPLQTSALIATNMCQSDNMQSSSACTTCMLRANAPCALHFGGSEVCTICWCVYVCALCVWGGLDGVFGLIHTMIRSHCDIPQQPVRHIWLSAWHTTVHIRELPTRKGALLRTSMSIRRAPTVTEKCLATQLLLFALTMQTTLCCPICRLYVRVCACVCDVGAIFVSYLGSHNPPPPLLRSILSEPHSPRFYQMAYLAQAVLLL